MLKNKKKWQRKTTIFAMDSPLHLCSTLLLGPKMISSSSLHYFYIEFLSCNQQKDDRYP